jgi:DNA-binding NarL/FixJ family response regulator
MNYHQIFRNGACIPDEWSKPWSAREREIALLVGRGLRNKDIAHELRLSNGTVKLHVHSIFLKLGMRRRHALVHMISRSQPTEKAAWPR